MDLLQRALYAGCILAFATLACARQQSTHVDSVRSLKHDGQERDYHVHIPASIDLTNPVPLVMVFHGGGGRAQNAIRMSNFNAVADEAGFIVVYPNGTGPRDVEVYTWNAGDCCANAMADNVDDVGFVRAILADMQNIASIDLKRVYAAGMSNGAMMSYRLGCEAADVFAAIAPVAGALTFTPCAPSEPVSVIHFHGTADEHVPYEGGIGPNAIYPVDYVSVADSVAFWVAFDGCPLQPEISQLDGVQHKVWSGCEGGTSVELYTIPGGGHIWPGGIRDEGTGQDLSATQLIWEFFAAHPKP